jgi:hypothetical protein
LIGIAVSSDSKHRFELLMGCFEAIESAPRIRARWRGGKVPAFLIQPSVSFPQKSSHKIYRAAFSIREKPIPLKPYML